MKSLVAVVLLALFLVASVSACFNQKGELVDGHTSGDMNFSNPESCTTSMAAGICYETSGSLDGGNIQFSGSGFFSPSACVTNHKTGMCCAQNVTGTAVGSHLGKSAEFEFSYMGLSCEKPKTPTTAKFNGTLMVTGTGGALEGAQGMGKVKYTEKCASDCLSASPGAASATVAVSGHGKKP